LADKWKAFGWQVKIVNGHNISQLILALKEGYSQKHQKPFAIIAKTIKGKGISFMENNSIWHYRIPAGEELDTARRELSCE
ncbi:MAG TPA: transketolase, partial [Candidatus Omnitrophica bacterium]|nr:transketolase [Candidatus Omnitrophota bacterium]